MKKPMRARYTMKTIADISTKAGIGNFSEETLKARGDALSNYGSNYIGDDIVITRKVSPSKSLPEKERFFFDPTTGFIKPYESKTAKKAKK